MKLDKYQLMAVEAKIKNALVVAAPGSGKTTVIINRVKYLIDNNIKNENIFVITFTKAAAMNMKERYIRTYKSNRTPFFGTFHGLFYRILLNEGYKINIISEQEKNRLIETVLKKYSDGINEDRIKEVINNISIFKTSGEEREYFKPSISKEIFLESLNAYEDYKKKKEYLDFDDLALKVLEILKNNRKATYYRNIMRYLLVDEFQDCDLLQIEFLKIINNQGENSLFAVGDEDQCIYSFRGSKPEYMVKFNSIFNGGKKYFLSVNYRSKNNIVEKAKKLIQFNKERNDKEQYANKKEDGEIGYLVPYDEKEQGEKVCEIVNANIALGGRYEDIVVLYRTNLESSTILDALTKKKIPFTLLEGGYSIFDHFICKDLIAYMELSYDIYSKENFFRIINKPFRYVSKANLEYVSKYKNYEDPFQILINKEDVPPFQKKNLEKLKRDILSLKNYSLSTAFQMIISDLDYLEHLKSYSERLGTSVDDLEEIVEEFKVTSSSFKTLLELKEHIQKVKEEIEKGAKEEDKNRVTLATIHRVKGMEFNTVILINANEESMPHISSMEENIEEERRVFYVGMTRAINRLFVIAPKTRGGKFREKSRFVEEGEFHLEQQNIDYGINEKDTVYHRSFGEGIVKKLEGSKITILFNDNTERSFDVNVLMKNNLIMTIK